MTQTIRSIPRWRKILGGLAVAVLVLTGAGWYHAYAPPAESTKGRPPQSLRNISALGRLEPNSPMIQLAAPSGSEMTRVLELKVREGDRVTAGSVVAIMDTHAQKTAAFREAELRVRVQKAKLAQIRAGAKADDVLAQQAAVARSTAQFRSAQADFDRLQRIGSSVTPTEMDKQKMELDRTQFDLEQARAILAGLKEVRSVDVELQEQEIASAQAAVEHAKADVEATIIRTPIDGSVLKIHTWPGAKIGDKGLLEIGNTDQMDAVAEVYESDVSRVEVGQPVRIRLGSSGMTLTGQVVEVGRMIGRKDVLNNDPVADTDARVVEVRVRLTPEDSRRVAGLTNARVEVEIMPQ